ncbi:MAG: U32 family peptidase, partial [Tissierellales bacterium]|nr:U32 family peptidase [Tissierellales bacterium]
MKKYEILAPVGSRESFFAAISAGADAIYMGGKLFNARHYASNFEIDEIRELVKYAHLRCVKIYITMNTLLKDEELKETLEYIKDLYEAGVDALIIQDLGLYYILRKYCPEFEIHASTQMSIHNASGVAVCQKMGFSRVVLAREVKISEILKASKVGPELEVFVHGALCQSYSGQCLMSSMLGGRSGNRGRCAQPCRLPYEIVNVDSENTIGKTKYYLSPKDLCTIDKVSELLEAGVHSLKIEGRMKRPEYVATVVNHYKTKLEETERDSSDKMIEELMQIFNRGFTEGLAFNDRGADYFSEDKPNNRGIELGRVRASKNKNNWIIESSRGLESGDGIEFRFENKSYGMIIDEIKELKSNCYELYFKENLAGFTAYRTSQKKLIDKAQMWSKEKRIPHKVRLWIELKEGDTLKLRAFEEENEIWVSAEGDVPSQKAQKIGLSEEKIMQSLSKLKDTYFEFNEVNADIQEGLFLQVKEINSCRRKLVEKLEEIYHKRPELDSNREIVSDELFSKSKNSLRNKELYLSANYRDLSKFSKD